MIRQLLSKFASFGLSVAINFLVGVISVPLLIAFVGSEAWAGIVVAQSIAGLAGVVVGFGWNVTGPTMIAGVSSEKRLILLRNSLWIRLGLYVAVAPVAVLCSMQLTGLDAPTAATVVLSYLLTALGCAWYFVGEGRPFRMFWLDTVPRNAGILGGLVVVAATGSVLHYAIVAFAGALTGTIVSYVSTLRGMPRSPRLPLRNMLHELREQRHGVVTSIAATLYAGSPPILASIFLPQAIEVFALGYRIFTFAVNAAAPFLQVFQGWIPSEGHGQLCRRIRVARNSALLLAVIVISGVPFLMPVAASILSGGRIELPLVLDIAISVSIGAVLVSQVVGLACLAAVGEIRRVAQATILGCGIGLVATVLLAATYGLGGLAIGMAVTEVIVASSQIVFLGIWLRRLRDVDRNS